MNKAALITEKIVILTFPFFLFIGCSGTDIVGDSTRSAPQSFQPQYLNLFNNDQYLRDIRPAIFTTKTIVPPATQRHGELDNSRVVTVQSHVKTHEPSYASDANLSFSSLQAEASPPPQTLQFYGENILLQPRYF